ncbi:MAG TPA: hypothetical protein VG965_05665 [Patescibacteria group bacterium]|nr:hypothetical protein [Patescibacteria group bacterium]
MKKYIFPFLVVFSLFLFALTFRGQAGNPTPHQIEFEENSSGQAFETSQERSRYAIILSLINDHSFAIDNYASMGTPDIGALKGHYYSFFPPAVSMMAIPLYILGTQLGAAQIFTFSISTIFSFLTIIMIFLFSKRLGLHWSISAFAAVAFGFATNAWGYSVTLYAHLVSAFLLLLGLFVVLPLDDKKRGIKAILAWFLYSMAVFVDFPNLFIFLPIVGLATLKMVNITEFKEKFKIKINWFVIFAPIIFLALMTVYGYYNYIHFGSPLKFSNTIPRVKDLKNTDLSAPESGTDATGALRTRNLLNGLTSFTVSHDRGILVYSPVVLLFIFGVGYLKKSKKWEEAGLLALPATCLVLYSMFGDPYGGWAFGSRYMIAVLPELCILAGVGLQRFAKNLLVKIIYIVVFTYSAAISLLAPLTTNVIPPYVEARYINLDSWYIINIRMLQKGELDSFFYNFVLQKSIPAVAYYFVILALVVAAGAYFIFTPKKDYENE